MLPPPAQKTEGPVDLVYLWCDGHDPVWAAKKQRAMEAAGIPYEPQSHATGDMRYMQMDELRYSLRSALANVPWINHIFIVTDNQRPHWLKDHPKITVVDQNEIIPAEIQPTFSSDTIEAYLDQIPGLSEKFLYLNDDFFFNKPLKPTDFFDGDKPIVWLERPKKDFPLSLAAIKANTNYDGAYIWYDIVARTWIRFCEKNGINHEQFPFRGPSHSVDAFTKTLYRKVIGKYPEIRILNNSTFRSSDVIQRVIFAYEFSYTAGCKTYINPKHNIISRIKALLPGSLCRGMYTIYSGKIRGLKRKLRHYKPQTFCLNNISPGQSDKSIRLLEEKFPVAAPWESA